MNKLQTHSQLSEAQTALLKAQAILDYVVAEGDLHPDFRKILQNALKNVDLAVVSVVSTTLDTL